MDPTDRSTLRVIMTTVWPTASTATIAAPSRMSRMLWECTNAGRTPAVTATSTASAKTMLISRAVSTLRSADRRAAVRPIRG
ncbi:hypothetical protein Ga0074812_104209 [Parafrankia irregularis]|uniref:Uncharacterized protein n=1 Tax=Parafrankia irregularis TaxID=795642 RepID=A0A0S4QJY3_9ACTN|nr:hypothetical protein Ga0074812_104209 [Parafrankia irregularis]